MNEKLSRIFIVKSLFYTNSSKKYGFLDLDLINMAVLHENIPTKMLDITSTNGRYRTQLSPVIWYCCL